MKLLFLVILVIFSYSLFAQTHEEKNLLNITNSSNHDTLKISAFIRLGEIYIQYKNPKAQRMLENALNLSEKINYMNGVSDSYNAIGDYYYETGDYHPALKYYRKALKLNLSLKNKKKESQGYLNIGNIYSDQGKYNFALEYYEKSGRLSMEIKNEKGISVYYISIANIYKEQGRLNESLDCYLKSLKYGDELKDKNHISRCYANIGIIYAMQNMFEQSLKYLEKALKIKEELQDIKGIYGNLSNIGNIYYLQGNTDKALLYYIRSQKMMEQTGNKREISGCYNNIGNIYSENKDYQKALDYFIKSLAIDEELEDIKGIAIVTQNIAGIYIKLKNYDKALTYINISMDYSRITGSIDDIRTNCFLLSEIHDSLHNYKEAYKYHKLYSKYNDSIFNIESTKSLNEMESLYQNEKKQKEIELQKSEIKQQKIQKTAFSIGFILVLILLIVAFYSFMQKKKANKLLAEQKHEIEEKNEELNQQNEEIAAQRDEIEHQRDKISLINENITESIKYAERIQSAVIPSNDFIQAVISPQESNPKNYFSDFFVIFKPKDIVSGDFYWFARKGKMLLFAVGDCTGHGVPGAFMSMMGISILNDIVSRKEIQTSADVLNHLRTHIIQSLHQKGNYEINHSVKDGMDIAFVAINTETMELQFAGANNPLMVASPHASASLSANGAMLHIKEICPDLSTITLNEVKGDKQPIGIHEKMNPFTNQIFQLQKGDTIYLFSDGYQSQFGG
ncbi:MAG: hypothetical protein A2309_10515, partial [Bacteroidetes bacterium RIFOXYB2_FULL_35_7]